MMVHFYTCIIESILTSLIVAAHALERDANYDILPQGQTLYLHTGGKQDENYAIASGPGAPRPAARAGVHSHGSLSPALTHTYMPHIP